MHTSEESPLLPFAKSLLRLLQGVVYIDETKYWDEIRANQQPIRRFVAQIGLELVFVPEDGYAYIYQPEPKDPNEKSLPRLMRTRQLKYEQSLLCILLREAMEELDSASNISTRLYITKGEIKERIEIFFKDHPNKSRLYKELDTGIEYTIRQLGILRLIQEDELFPDNTRYEISRIIKAMITAEQLEDAKLKLFKHLNPDTDE
nr:DUF4194 domain-containing protein [uncultured Chitinophaga sp.]